MTRINKRLLKFKELIEKEPLQNILHIPELKKKENLKINI